ncbi:hypothetical protein D3C75_1049240 [compost metagenome]
MVLFTDADSAITDFDPCLTVLTVHLKADRALGAITQGVGQQVGNHLFNAKFIPIAHHRLLGVKTDRRLGGLDLRGEILYQTPSQRRQVEVCGADRQLAGADA